MKINNVLSLFDGMSCGQIALKEIGITPNKYFASEVDKYAMKITNHNFVNTIQIGDVRNVKFKDGVLCTEQGEFEIGKIDLILGGSPCQNFSFAGRQQGMTTKEKIEVVSLEQYEKLVEDKFEFEGQSYLFWEYVRVLKEVKKYNKDVIFLLENVVMSSRWESIISSVLEVEPILINSSLVSAQNRRRLYWSNIQNIKQPEDRNIKLNDILQNNEWREIIPSFYKKWGGEQRINKGVNQVGKEKLNCITTKRSHPNQYLFNFDRTKMRLLSIDEIRTGQTIPKWYDMSLIPKTQQEKCIGNGWTIEVIKHIFKNI